MSGGLRDFLVRLATDPDCLSQFMTDPAGALDRAGLPAEDRAAVLSRDSDRLRSALGASAADHLTQMLNSSKKGLKKAPPKKRPGAKKRPTPKKRRTAGKKR
jgi:hypothetical protein